MEVPVATGAAAVACRLWSCHRYFTDLQKIIFITVVTFMLAVSTGSWLLFICGALAPPIAIATLRSVLEKNELFNSHILLPMIARSKDIWRAVRSIALDDDVEELRNDVSYTLESQIQKALRLIHQDFVQSWYSFISENPQIPSEGEQLLQNLTQSLLSRISTIDVHTFAENVIILYNDHLRQYHDGRETLKRQPSYRRRKSDNKTEFKKYRDVEHVWEKKGWFHEALKQGEASEFVYLRGATDALLKVLLPYTSFQCTSGKEALQEILTCNVLHQIINLIADPDWLHTKIIQITSDEELQIIPKEDETEEEVCDDGLQGDAIGSPGCTPSDSKTSQKMALTRNAFSCDSLEDEKLVVGNWLKLSQAESCNRGLEASLSFSEPKKKSTHSRVDPNVSLPLNSFVKETQKRSLLLEGQKHILGGMRPGIWSALAEKGIRRAETNPVSFGIAGPTSPAAEPAGESMRDSLTEMTEDHSTQALERPGSVNDKLEELRLDDNEEKMGISNDASRLDLNDQSRESSLSPCLDKEEFQNEAEDVNKEGMDESRLVIGKEESCSEEERVSMKEVDEEEVKGEEGKKEAPSSEQQYITDAFTKYFRVSTLEGIPIPKNNSPDHADQTLKGACSSNTATPNSSRNKDSTSTPNSSGKTGPKESSATYKPGIRFLNSSADLPICMDYFSEGNVRRTNSDLGVGTSRSRSESPTSFHSTPVKSTKRIKHTAKPIKIVTSKNMDDSTGSECSDPLFHALLSGMKSQNDLESSRSPSQGSRSPSRERFILGQSMERSHSDSPKARALSPHVSGTPDSLHSFSSVSDVDQERPLFFIGEDGKIPKLQIDEISLNQSDITETSSYLNFSDTGSLDVNSNDSQSIKDGSTSAHDAPSTGIPGIHIAQCEDLSSTLEDTIHNAPNSSFEDVGSVVQSPGLNQSGIPDQDFQESFHSAPDTSIDDDLVAEAAMDVLDCEENLQPSVIFTHVSIPATEVTREYRSETKYTLYTIEYNAWHRSSPDEPAVRKTSVVKRRFREFLNLQDRLEKNPQYRSAMKGVKSPTRWTTLPFGNLDKLMIDKRQKSLEKFLQVLCSKEIINTGIELQEFLAYERDASIAFVKKASEVPRIDKLLVKTVTGVFDKMATVLPSLPQDAANSASKNGRSQNMKRKRSKVELDFTVDKDELSIDFQVLDNKVTTPNAIESLLYQTIESFEAQPESEPVSDGDDDVFHETAEGRDFSIMPRPQGDGCDEKDLPVEGEEVNWSDRDIPLSVAVLDLAVETAKGRDSWVCQEGALILLKLLLAKAIDKWLREEISDLTTPTRCGYYLSLLLDAIWPNGHMDNTPSPRRSRGQLEVTKRQARRCLANFFPGFLRALIGQEDFEYSVDQVMDSIQYPKLNRHFGYCLLDMLIEAIVPEINTTKLQHQLLWRH